MIDAKSISEEQKAQIQTWADEGAGLSGIQEGLNSEFGIKVTYMEMRFLIDDLAIAMPVEEKPEPEPEPDEAATEAEATEAPTDSEDSGEAEPTTEVADEIPADPENMEKSSVSVTISDLERPGMMVNGSVTFTGGEVADWYLDQYGRLGMDPKNPDFRPTESDMMAFQKELQEAAQKKGI